VSGSSGLIGGRLCNALRDQGHRVFALVRREPRPNTDEIFWNPDAGDLKPASVEGFDAVVHLAGESIAAGRWTKDRKRAIRESRSKGTFLLGQTLAGLEKKPRVFISASAVGFYGHRGEEAVDEDSPPGQGFLPEVCREWESASEPARDAGIRVVNPRIGMVLSADGGALARMLGPFKAGLGGVVGDGRQYVSWISIDDLVAALTRILADERLRGPVNAVSPQPVTNRDLVTTLAKVLHRPAVVPMPAMAVKVMFGEMGQSLLLEGARVKPTRLLRNGFVFRYPDLESVLRHELA